MESGLPNWSRGAWAHGTGSGVLGILFIAAGPDAPIMVRSVEADRWPRIRSCLPS